jgi:hypothetical protein
VELEDNDDITADVVEDDFDVVEVFEVEVDFKDVEVFEVFEVVVFEVEDDFDVDEREVVLVVEVDFVGLLNDDVELEDELLLDPPEPRIAHLLVKSAVRLNASAILLEFTPLETSNLVVDAWLELIA